MIKLKNVSKFYYNKGIIASGFSKINLELKIGEFVAITGESGSGKSTLLNVISGLDTYEEGEMYINGQETSHYSERDFEEYRRKYISNIFQNFNLVNSYTVKQNIELVMLLNGKKKSEINTVVVDLMKKVNLYRYRNTKVSKLSGGQKQRVAIARALAKETPIIIADEPTGNLDTKSAKEIVKLLHEISKDKLVIIVTHNIEQVEEYITREIKMHDGKILSDKKMKKVETPSEVTESQIKSITLLGKLTLGIRNTFNIIPKFLLVFLVYLFIVVAVMTEYAFFKKQEYTASKSGYNYFFQDTTDTRIVIKKQDRTFFTEEDYEKIAKISQVEKIVKNDLLLDTIINVTDGSGFWFNATVYDKRELVGKVDVGRLPESEDEIILVGSRNDYELGDRKDETIGSTVYLEGMRGNSFKDLSLKIVGIQYDENSFSYGVGKVYVDTQILEKLKVSFDQQSSNLKVLFQNQYHNSYSYDIHYQVIPTDKVAIGKAIISANLNDSCPKGSCVNQPLTVEVHHPYYQDHVDVTVTNTYTKKNMETLLGIKEYEDYDGAIFISSTDYHKLYSKGIYQSSVFVNHVTNLESVDASLKELGLDTLKIKDTLVTGGAVEVMKILRTIVTVVLVITLFFISYFVIRIILKSRNTYFGIIRILGATKQQAKQLLIIELLTVSNLAYFLFMSFLFLNYQGSIQVGFLHTILEYLRFSDYVLLYCIITLMSYLISLRFARKIFKNSAMSTMREVV